MRHSNSDKFETNVEELVISIPKNNNRKKIYFEQSYRTIYNLCMIPKICNVNSNNPITCDECECGYCKLFCILKKHQNMYENFDSFCVLMDICLYPLNKGKTPINDWFYEMIKRFHEIVIYNTLLNIHNHNIPREICSIISSNVYDDNLKTYDNLLKKSKLIQSHLKYVTGT